MARIEDESPMNEDEIERELGVVDEAELREAEELARALSRGVSNGEEASVAEMVELSALLRVSTELELAPARQRAIFEELEKAQARKSRTIEPERRAFRWWWLLALPLPLTVAALLLFFVTTRPNGLAQRDGTSGEAASVRAGVALPDPPPSLLTAQARAIAGSLSQEAPGAGALGANESLALADYDRELGQYRGRWLSALHDQYQP